MHQVKIYKGDYNSRQNQANNDKAVLYVEHHFNSSPDKKTDYALVIVSSNASKKSRDIAKYYVDLVAKKFNLKLGDGDGVMPGGYGGRGDGNLRYTDMPAILLEPIFGSNPHGASIIKSKGGQESLASILADTIKKFFPAGGLIAFSVGHKYKTSEPKDRGAVLVGGGNEADYAEIVLNRAKEILEQKP